MAQQTLNLGTAPDDGTGDTLRDGGGKINNNFTELYGLITGFLTSQGAGLRVEQTWPALAAITGTDGAGAEVIGDTGTHTDPVTSATVSNSGIFRYQTAAPAGWKRIASSVDVLVQQMVATALTALQISFANTDRYYLNGRQVLIGQADVNLRAQHAVFLDGTKIDYAPAGATVASSLITSNGDTISAPDRYYVGGKQALFAYVDVNKQVLWAAFLDGTVYTAGAAAAASTAQTAPIIVLGDSLSAITGGQVSYAAALQALFPTRTIINFSIGGQSSRAQVLQAGMKACPVTVQNNQIVAGSNTVTAMGGTALAGMATAAIDNFQFLSTNADIVTRSTKVTVGSTVCTLTRTATGGPPSTTETYTLTPDGDQVLPAICPPGTPMVAVNANPTATVIFRTGRNDYLSPATVLDSLDCAIAWAKHGRIIASSITNGLYSNERADTAFASPQSGWVTIFGLEQSIAGRLPGRFQDIRRSLIDRALSKLSITPTTQDAYDVSTDTVPWSLHLIEMTGVSAASIASGDTSFTITPTTGAVVAGRILQLESEFILINGVSGNTVTSCTRGFGGSTAATHASGVAATTKDNIHRTTASYGFEASEDSILLNAKGF